MANEFTDGERFLLRVFGEYLEKIFEHDDAVPGTPLVELATMNGFDDIESASFLADNELASDLAATLCRRACRHRTLSQELTQLLACAGPSELEDLPMVASMRSADEIEEKFGAEMRRKARTGSAVESATKQGIPCSTGSETTQTGSEAAP